MAKRTIFKALARKEALGLAVPEGVSKPQSFYIPGRLPGLNDLMRNRHETSRLKKQHNPKIVARANACGWEPPAPSYWGYLFCEADRRRDPANIVGGGMKLIEDALQKHGLLRNDGWNHVLGYCVHWVVDNIDPGVLVYSSPCEITLALLHKEKLKHVHAPEEGWNPLEDCHPHQVVGGG